MGTNGGSVGNSSREEETGGELGGGGLLNKITNGKFVGNSAGRREGVESDQPKHPKRIRGVVSRIKPELSCALRAHCEGKLLKDLPNQESNKTKRGQTGDLSVTQAEKRKQAESGGEGDC